jgi:hypothetical protein
MSRLINKNIIELHLSQGEIRVYPHWEIVYLVLIRYGNIYLGLHPNQLSYFNINTGKSLEGTEALNPPKPKPTFFTNM